MKGFMLIWMFLITQASFCITRNVSIDGTHEYTTIQSAINASANGDIVQVYPGVYAEAVETNGKSITLQSLYPITLSQQTIDNTIIHPSTVSSCIEIDQGETVTINGFTLTNNDPVNLIPEFYDSDNDGVWGGGIEINDHSGASIRNCIIQNCMSEGGGIVFQGSTLYLSNTIIRNCIGTQIPGGLFVYGNDATQIEFDNIHPNSIYDNTGGDVYLMNITIPLQITFAMFSISLAVPDHYFFYTNNCQSVQITVQNAYLNLINHDLFVSPNGDDTNSGLSSSEPFRTINHAIQIIQPDSLDPKTIHLAPGLYSIANNDQFFPLQTKSHIRLMGDSIQTTVLDENGSDRYYLAVAYQKNVEISNLKLVGYPEAGAPLGFGFSNNIVFKNLEFDGNFGYMNGFEGINSHDIVLENILVHNSSTSDLDNTAFRMFYVDNLVMNNCIVDNLHINGSNANNLGFEFFESDVVIRNSIISNCTAGDAFAFFYQNINEGSENNRLDMSNMLMFNNYSQINDPWAWALFSVNNIYQRTQINNCTFANNSGSDTCPVQIIGNADVRNCIFYNPLMYWDVGFTTNTEQTIPYSVSISNSLVHRTVAGDNLALVQQSSMLNNSNPLFVGGFSDSLAMSDPAYYKLNSDSPCINAGLQDTTGLNIPRMDLAGNYRVWDGRIDMGCYEYGSTPVGNEEQIHDPEVSSTKLTTFPNPVVMSGTRGAYVFIEFTLPQRAKEPTLIEIFNIKGQRVKSMKLIESYTSFVQKAGLSKDVKQNGEFFSTVWDCRNDQNQKIASGLYIVRVTSGNQNAVKKMMVLK